MLLKFMSLPMLEEDDGLNIGGTGEEEQEVAEPVNEEGGEEQHDDDFYDKLCVCGHCIS